MVSSLPPCFSVLNRTTGRKWKCSSTPLVAGMCRHCIFKSVHLWGPPLAHCEIYAEMVQSPDVESPNPNPPPSIPTDESQPLTQQGWHLIEFPWFQWAHTQDLQVPVFAFDKQMTPMELRSQPAKTRVGKRKIKSRTDTRPISAHAGLSPMMFTLWVLSPRCIRKIHPLHWQCLRCRLHVVFFFSSFWDCSSCTRIRCMCK